MRARIAESFTRSLARLEGPERAAVKRAAFDFLLGPRSPGLRVHRLVHREDPRFWSLRVGRDLRVIVHRDGDEVVLCHAGHHDRAYDWAEHRVGAPGPAGGREEAWSLELAPGPGPSTPEGRPPFPASAPAAASSAGTAVGRAAAVCDAPSVPRAPRPAAPELPSPRRLRVWRRAAGPLPPASDAALGGTAPAPLLQLLRIFQQVEAQPPRTPPHGAPPAPAGARVPPMPGPGEAGGGPAPGRLREVLLVALAALVPLLGALLALRARRAARDAGRAREEALLAGRRSVEALAVALETLRAGERPALPGARPPGGESRAWEALRALDRFLAMEPQRIRSLADAPGAARPPRSPA